MEDQWLHENMGAILVAIEILWVGGVIAVFSLYFILKWRFRKKKEQELAAKAEAAKSETQTENIKSNTDE